MNDGIITLSKLNLIRMYVHRWWLTGVCKWMIFHKSPFRGKNDSYNRSYLDNLNNKLFNKKSVLVRVRLCYSIKKWNIKLGYGLYSD